MMLENRVAKLERKDDGRVDIAQRLRLAIAKAQSQPEKRLTEAEERLYIEELKAHSVDRQFSEESRALARRMVVQRERDLAMRSVSD